jgi:hypothetical protein
MKLVPAPLERPWMDQTNQRFAYRCLPLNIANQAGWLLTCPCTFDLYWYGGDAKTDIEFRFLDPPDPCVSSHFGYGVVTFSLPYLFRTPPGINLWVKGPSNAPKDGIQALEGVVPAAARQHLPDVRIRVSRGQLRDAQYVVGFEADEKR